MYERLWNGTHLVILISIVSVVIIAATYWGIVYSKGYQSASEEHSTYRAERDAQDRYYKKCLQRETIYSARECITNTPNTDRDAQRAEQDLDAQRQMAQWAEGMLWATWVIGLATASVAALGTWLLYHTLKETSALNKTTTEAFLNDQRPWLGLNTKNLPSISPNEFGWRIDFKIEVKNFGKSPATNVVGEARILIFDPIMDQFDVDAEVNEFKDALVAGVTKGRGDFQKTVYPGESDLIGYFFEDFHKPVKAGRVGIICYGVGYSFPATNKIFTTVRAPCLVELEDSTGNHLLNLADIFNGEEHSILLGSDGRGSGLHDHEPKNN